MRVPVFNQERPIEYSILDDVQPAGRSVGTYAGREIPESVVDEFGRRFVYVGVAPRKWNGRYDGDALGPGEFIVRPGLVYRYENTKPSWWGTLFGARHVRDKAA
jgi:hypothetical protein